VFRLLGRMSLELPGRKIELGPAKQRCLLACLLLAPGQVVPVEVLIDRIWPTRPPARARNLLATYVCRLRRAIHGVAPWIRPDDFRFATGGYLFAGDWWQVDLHQARSQIRQARASNADCQAGILRRVLSGWEPIALAGVPGAWAARVRESLRAERQEIVVQWAQTALHLGHTDDVVSVLRDALADDPVAEDPAELMMRVLADRGRFSEALRYYARLRQALADELGVRPSWALQELHLTILRGDSGRDRDPDRSNGGGDSARSARRAGSRYLGQGSGT
jgi:DNA-binding SARP family transcriptional activator